MSLRTRGLQKMPGFQASFRRLLPVFLFTILVACGGGGTTDSSSPIGTISTGSGGSTNSCSPNLCVGFSYPTATVVRLFTASVNPGSASALTGYRAHYEISSGSLPTGMTLDASTGIVSGTPTANGPYSATIVLTVANFSGSLSTPLLLSVEDPMLNFYATYPIPGDSDFQTSFFLPGVTLKPSGLTLVPNGSIENSTDVIIGSAGQIHYQVTGPVPLPPGLQLDAKTGILSGTPTQTGAWFVAFQATTAYQGSTSTFSVVVPISVGAIVIEHAGQTAAPVQIHITAAPGTTFDHDEAMGGGNMYFNITYDTSTATVTIIPGPLPDPYLAGTYAGAYHLYLSTPNGPFADAGYVEVIDSNLQVH